MPKPKDLNLNAYEIAEEQATSQVKSTIEIICDILVRELVDSNHSENNALKFVQKGGRQSEL